MNPIANLMKEKVLQDLRVALLDCERHQRAIHDSREAPWEIRESKELLVGAQERVKKQEEIIRRLKT